MLLLILYFGRLIAPDPNPMGTLATIGVGWAGAIIGAIAAAFIWPSPQAHVLGGALIVSLISGSRRHRYYV